MSKNSILSLKRKISDSKECANAIERSETIDPGKDLEDQKKVQNMRHDEDKHMLRKKYLPRLYKLIVVYLIVIGVIITINMHPIISISKHSFCMHFVGLSDSVIIALLTTTTANILGIFYIAVRWLFPVGD